MSSPQTVRRLSTPALLVAVVVLLAAVVTACDAGTPPAATVYGSEISAATIIADLKAEASNKATATPVTGFGLQDTYKSDAAAAKLRLRIFDEVLAHDLAQRHVTWKPLSDTELESAICNGSAGCTKGYPKAYQTFLAGLFGKYTAFGKAVKYTEPKVRSQAELEAAARQEYEAALASNPSQLQQLCYSAAKMPDQASADALKAKVAAGGDLVALAKAAGVAADSTASNVCDSASNLPTQIQSATPGAVLVIENADPNSGSGTIPIVVKVEKPKTQSFDDVKASIISSLQQSDQQAASTAAQSAVSAALLKLLGRAEVTVNPSFGTWDKRKGSVIPPVPPKGYVPPTTTPVTVPATSGAGTTGTGTSGTSGGSGSTAPTSGSTSSGG